MGTLVLCVSCRLCSSHSSPCARLLPISYANDWKGSTMTSQSLQMQIFYWTFLWWVNALEHCILNHVAWSLWTNSEDISCTFCVFGSVDLIWISMSLMWCDQAVPGMQGCVLRPKIESRKRGSSWQSVGNCLNFTAPSPVLVSRTYMATPTQGDCECWYLDCLCESRENIIHHSCHT